MHARRVGIGVAERLLHAAILADAGGQPCPSVSSMALTKGSGRLVCSTPLLSWFLGWSALHQGSRVGRTARSADAGARCAAGDR